MAKKKPKDTTVNLEKWEVESNQLLCQARSWRNGVMARYESFG